MTLASYCHKKGYTLSQYETLKQNIDTITTALIQQIPGSKKDNGMYYPINELLPYNTDAELKPFYIASLKQKGIEFYDNNNLWRY